MTANSWNSDTDQYTKLCRAAFKLGEKHARELVVDRLGCPLNDDTGAYQKLSDAAYDLFPKEEEPPFDAGFAAGLAVGLRLAGGVR